jgi:hypothetical protein
MPDTIGDQWSFDVQNLFDQSVGVVATFPSPSYMNFGGHHGTIANMTPTYDVVGDSFYEMWLLTEGPSSDDH